MSIGAKWTGRPDRGPNFEFTHYISSCRCVARFPCFSKWEAGVRAFCAQPTDVKRLVISMRVAPVGTLVAGPLG